MEILSRSAKETKKAAEILAAELTSQPLKKALVIALEGNLGSGKTTFVQGFARALGVKDNVLSPTFVLMKVYSMTRMTRSPTSYRSYHKHTFKHLIHIDCYRLDFPKDLIHLGFKDLIKDKDAIILIEWADRVRELIPQNASWIRFRHGKKSHERILYTTT